jgi:hypothetical protein
MGRGTAEWVAKQLALLFIALTLALIPAIPAAAALVFEVRMEPPNPTVGNPATVIVRIYNASTDSARPRGMPRDLGEFPWTVEALSPDGERSAIVLSKSEQAGEWRGTFTFDTSGSWMVGLADQHFGSPADPAMGGRTQVIVSAAPRERTETSESSPTVWPWFAGLAGLGAAATLWTYRRRHLRGLRNTA